MKIKIKKISIENFKGIEKRTVDFSDRTSIKGMNAVGKTSIVDAVWWLLFNKNSIGDEKFKIRPLDKEGNTIHNIEISVRAIFDVDGKDVELLKVQKENWVKKRGSATPTLQGNVNSFEVDGYPKSEKDYKEYISSLVDEDLFKMITNPTYFVSKKWKEQRDILIKFVNNVPDIDLAKSNEKFSLLVSEIEKAPSLDDIKAKYTKALTEWKKKQLEIPVRIDELSKQKTDIDVAELELAKADLERKIVDIDSKSSNENAEYDNLMKESMQLQFDLSAIMQEMNNNISENRHEIENEKRSTENEIKDTNQLIKLLEESISKSKCEVEECVHSRESLKKNYLDCKKSTFNESEYIFDESSTVCSLCGQALPPEKVAELRETFSSKKKQAKESFENDKSKMLKDIEAEGTNTADKIKSLELSIEKAETDLEKNKEKVSMFSGKVDELSCVLEKLTPEADYAKNRNYVEKKDKLNEVEAKISDIRDKPVSDSVSERKTLSSALDEVKAELVKVSKNIEYDERIEELEDEQKDVNQKVADQEQMIYLLEEFVRSKMEIVSKSINDKFKTVCWKLFETQLNGGMKECCECTVNGVPFSALNSGHRIVAGLDIISSLSELYGVSAPIFVDNAESVNDFNIPHIDAQMVLLSVSEDKNITIE